MKLILKKDVKDLGPQGAVVNVSDGHARNFLIPKGFAVPATEKAMAQIKRQKTVEEGRLKKDKNSAGKLTGKLDGHRITIKGKVNESGTLYAAINAKKIAEALSKAGFDVEESMVDFPSPCKELGDRKVKLNLPHGFKATIHLIIKKS